MAALSQHAHCQGIDGTPASRGGGQWWVCDGSSPGRKKSGQHQPPTVPLIGWSRQEDRPGGTREGGKYPSSIPFRSRQGSSSSHACEAMFSPGFQRVCPACVCTDQMEGQRLPTSCGCESLRAPEGQGEEPQMGAPGTGGRAWPLSPCPQLPRGPQTPPRGGLGETKLHADLRWVGFKHCTDSKSQFCSGVWAGVPHLLDCAPLPRRHVGGPVHALPQTKPPVSRRMGITRLGATSSRTDGVSLPLGPPLSCLPLVSINCFQGSNRAQFYLLLVCSSVLLKVQIFEWHQLLLPNIPWPLNHPPQAGDRARVIFCNNICGI